MIFWHRLACFQGSNSTLFLHSTLALVFYLDVVLTLSVVMTDNNIHVENFCLTRFINEIYIPYSRKSRSIAVLDEKGLIMVRWCYAWERPTNQSSVVCNSAVFNTGFFLIIYFHCWQLIAVIIMMENAIAKTCCQATFDRCYHYHSTVYVKVNICIQETSKRTWNSNETLLKQMNRYWERMV